MADKIRVGIVGATVTPGGSGWGANAHVPALKALPSYELKAVCTAHLLVQRVYRAPSHCAFDGEMREQAFDDLVAWIERGAKPEGEDVLAPDLTRIGLKWTRVLHPEDPLAPKR